MNKRIKKKYLKTNNLRRQNNILKKISKHFKIDNKVLGNGYFIFEMGDNSVCHFDLKETPNWKYGIWLENNDYKIFGEHEDLIDKFKPSRTYLSYKNDTNSFIEQVKKIKDNSKLYFVDSLTDGDALVAYKQHKDEEDIWYSGYQAVRLYNEESKCWNKFIRDETITQGYFVNERYKEFFDEKAQRLEDEEFDRKYAFNFFKELLNLFEDIVAVGVVDLNKDGWNCSPRYYVKIIVNSQISQEDFDSLYDKLEKLFYDKNYSDERKTYEHQFNLCGCCNDLSDTKDCDYRYFK